MAFDLVIRGADVYPGEGPCRRADVGILDGRIASVAPDLPVDAAGQIVEGAGLLLCPGFVDMHAHSALEPFRDPLLTPKIAQGFTTEVINPDGLVPAPVAPEQRAGRGGARGGQRDDRDRHRTGTPARAARRLRFADRGRVEPGLRADVVLLDPCEYVDSATYEDPCRTPAGVLGVFVAGRLAYADGNSTGERRGGVVRSPRRT